MIGQPDSPQAEGFRKIAGQLAARISIVNAERTELEKLNAGLKLL